MLLLAALLASGSPAIAGDGLRCGSRLIHEGDLIDLVQGRCGNPTSRSASTEFATFRTSSGAVVTREIPVEIWTYDRGSSSFVRRLKFRDGKLVSVRALDYGN